MVSIAAAPARVRVARRTGYWRLTSALLLMVLAVSFALIGLIDGFGWWFLMLLTASLVLVGGAGLRMLGVPPKVVPLLLLVEYGLIMTIGFGGGTGLLGVVPTPATFSKFGELFDQAMLSIYQQGTPAPPLPEFMFLIVAGSGLIAIFLDTTAIAFRIPAFSAIGIIAILIVPAALLGDGVAPIALAESAAAFLYLLRCDVRTRRPGAPRPTASLSIAAGSIVVALILSATAPGLDRGGATSFTAGGISIGGTVTPLIDLGRDLRRPAAVKVLTYTTTSSTPEYLKLASLDQFTGTVWKHRERDTKRLPVGNSIGPVTGLSDAVKTTKVSTSVQIANMQSRWLPVPFPVKGVHGLNGTWSWDPDDLTIGGVGTSTEGQQYTVTSLQLQPTADQLKAAGGFVPSSITRDLFVPSTLPPIIKTTAITATVGATNEYEMAVDLQNYFRNNGFVYSVQTPLKQGYDGDGGAVIAKFLEVKSGYCVHFASAMALMARTLGIPSRVTEGYLPGTSNGGSVNNPGIYTVTSDDLHAWPELYFAGVGWVPFEPTVSRGFVPAYTVPQTSNSTSSANPSASGAAGHASLAPEITNGPNSATGAPTNAVQPIASAFGVTLLVVLLLLTPAFLRRLRRRSRFRKLRDEWGLAILAWDELRDTARDLGWSVPDTETPRAFAERLRGAIRADDGSAAVGRLLTAVERESFGPPGRYIAHGVPDDLQEALSGLEAGAGRAVRVKALLAPVSIIPPSWSPSAGVRPTNA